MEKNIEETSEVLDEIPLEEEEIKLKNKPFLKWAGGKYKIFSTLNKYFPENGKKFFEPFVGAGSVALNVHYKECVINDVNHDLILTWKYLKKNKEDFVQSCKKLFDHPDANTREFFDSRKKELNSTDNKERKAHLFVYLNRHCFNGLCRYNGSNEFNVPFGKYDKPYFPEKELLSVVPIIENWTILRKDFREIFTMMEAGDVAYCDPPYVPVSESANFGSYSAGGFGLKDQFDLAENAQKASEKGVTVIISNHYNWYTKELYTKMFNGKIHKIQVSRTISSKVEKRESVGEIIAVFNGK